VTTSKKRPRSGDARTANWVIGDLAGALKAEGKDIAESPVSAEKLGELVALIGKGEISGKLAKEIFTKMWATGDSASAIINREGLRQISDTSALDAIIDDVLARNPAQVEQYKGRKDLSHRLPRGPGDEGFRGQANPRMVNGLIEQKLS
jgi:aspartyl-tRNA(Asn)/glutamyl-tRNA(Gln) amidotransferase subunit B